MLSYLGVWSLGLFSPTFFSTFSKKKYDQLEGGGHVNATKTVRDLYQLICMISGLKHLKR